jgi:hypothetical protein
VSPLESRLSMWTHPGACGEGPNGLFARSLPPAVPLILSEPYLGEITEVGLPSVEFRSTWLSW